MHSTLYASTATIALLLNACGAFQIAVGRQIFESSMRLYRRASLVMEGQHSDGPFLGDEPSGRLSDLPAPGHVIPRVGKQMPDQRPGWFRVPAPGGKYTKVSTESTTSTLVVPLRCISPRGESKVNKMRQDCNWMSPNTPRPCALQLFCLQVSA